MTDHISQETIRQILVDQQEEIKTRSGIPGRWQREQQRPLKAALGRRMIKVITGVRRSGKSTLGELALQDNAYLSVNFDDERLAGLKSSELSFVEKALLQINPDTKTYFFDEVQNIVGWELFANRLHRAGYNLVITGSNSKLLSKELATHLTGRHVLIEVFPFSFREIISQHHPDWLKSDIVSTRQEAMCSEMFRQYLRQGGFPEIWCESAAEVDLRLLENRIVTRDIVTRYRVKQTLPLRELARYCLGHPATLFSVNRVQKSFDFKSVHTLRQYLEYLEEVYLVAFVPAFSHKFASQLKQPKKLYSIDNGMSRAMSTRFLSQDGLALENVIFQELWRRGQEVYHLTTQEYAVDFVIRGENRIEELIQVCWALDSPDTYQREISALLRASKELHCRRLTVITYGDTQWPKFSKATETKEIRLIPGWRWLLNP